MRMRRRACDDPAETGVGRRRSSDVVDEMWGVMVQRLCADRCRERNAESQSSRVLGAATERQSRAIRSSGAGRAASDETPAAVERDRTTGRTAASLPRAELRRGCRKPDDDSSECERTQRDGMTGVLTTCADLPGHPSRSCPGGLGPALRVLARRSAVPVELDVRVDRRLPESAEVAAYYVLSEALTNAAKHADASVVHVEVEVDDSVLELAIRDDGAGGADTSRGSGLIGLSDRVEALGGGLELASPVGLGTSLLIRIPLETDAGLGRSDKA